MVELCEIVLDGLAMPAQGTLIIGDVLTWGCYSSVELLRHGLRVVEWVL